jgi:DNA repair exonuclease SbcCD ATPase subunit
LISIFNGYKAGWEGSANTVQSSGQFLDYLYERKDALQEQFDNALAAIVVDPQLVADLRTEMSEVRNAISYQLPIYNNALQGFDQIKEQLNDLRDQIIQLQLEHTKLTGNSSGIETPQMATCPVFISQPNTMNNFILHSFDNYIPPSNL